MVPRGKKRGSAELADVEEPAVIRDPPPVTTPPSLALRPLLNQEGNQNPELPSLDPELPSLDKEGRRVRAGGWLTGEEDDVEQENQKWCQEVRNGVRLSWRMSRSRL